MNRYFLPTGNAQFPQTGPGRVLLPLREVTPGANDNLLPCEVEEAVLEAVAGGPNWGNVDAQSVQQAWVEARYVGDTCLVQTQAQWDVNPANPAVRPPASPEVAQAATASLVSAATTAKAQIVKASAKK